MAEGIRPEVAEDVRPAGSAPEGIRPEEAAGGIRLEDAAADIRPDDAAAGGT